MKPGSLVCRIAGVPSWAKSTLTGDDKLKRIGHWFVTQLRTPWKTVAPVSDTLQLVVARLRKLLDCGDRLVANATS